MFAYSSRLERGYSKTCLKQPLKIDNKSLEDGLSLNAGQKYC